MKIRITKGQERANSVRDRAERVRDRAERVRGDRPAHSFPVLESSVDGIVADSSPIFTRLMHGPLQLFFTQLVFIGRDNYEFVFGDKKFTISVEDN